MLWWILVISSNFCCLIVIAFMSHLKGHLEILTSTLYHKSHLESHYEHSISNGIVIAKKKKFFLENVFRKKCNIYIQCTSIFFLFFSYSVSISLWYNYLFLCNFLFIHPGASIGVLDKRLFEFLEAHVH